MVGDTVIYRLIEEKVGISENYQFNFDKAYVLRLSGHGWEYLLTGHRWEDKIKAISGDMKDPVNKVYRNRPDTTVPPPFKISEPVGSYNDTDCGTFTFRDEAHLDKLDKILVAYQPELAFYTTLLETTGPWWLLWR